MKTEELMARSKLEKSAREPAQHTTDLMRIAVASLVIFISSMVAVITLLLLIWLELNG